MNFETYLPYAFALIIAIPFLVFTRQFVFAFIKFKNQELLVLNLKSNTENKLQAYERMTVFLERLKPANLVAKFDFELKAGEFIFLTEKNIQEEFEYNASQQIYIRQATWNNVVTSKNNIIQLLHKTFNETHQLKDLQEFKTVFLMKYVEESDFISETINDMRRDIALLN